jgi:ankyrin repeat protein
MSDKMFLNPDSLQQRSAFSNNQKKSPTADSKMDSERIDSEDRVDSGLGSIGLTSSEYSGSYSSYTKVPEIPERLNSKTDNSNCVKHTFDASQKIQEEDDVRVDSGLDCLELLSCDSSYFSSLANDFDQLSIDEIKKNTEPYSYSIIVPMEQRIKLFESDADGDSKLHLSILNGHQSLAFLLIKLAPHCNWLNYCNHLWQTPLHLAVLTNQAGLVRRLLCAGADATCQDKDGNTPLHIACKKGYEEIVRQLLMPVQKEELRDNTYDIPYQRLPQDLSIRNYEGETCLHIAVRHSHINIVSFLLAFGVDINIGDGKSGRTALHIASELNNVDIIKIILNRRDAKIDTRNYAGLTPVQLAYGRGHEESVKEICRHCHYTRADMSLHDSSDEDEDMLTDSD